MNWKSQITIVDPDQSPRQQQREANHEMCMALFAAGNAFAKRTDDFARGKAETCRDLANKLSKFGSFASDKQQQYALKLIEWAKPRAAKAPQGAMLPLLFAAMQKHADFFVGSLKISRRNQDSLCWLVWNDKVIGKIENGNAIVWSRKAADAGADVAQVQALLAELNANPLEAAKKYGRLSGRCAMCARDLTDQESIDLGIGPICLARGF